MISIFGQDGHDFEGLFEVLDVVRVAGPDAVLPDVPHEQLVLHQPLHRLDQQVRQLQLVAQLLLYFLWKKNNEISILLQEGIIKKIAYERLAYESVDEKSLS